MVQDCALGDFVVILVTGHTIGGERFVDEGVTLETDMRVAKAMARYQNIYISLYGRNPRELRDLGNTWVLVNGARMPVTELENLTDQLQKEYQQVLANKRNLVKKLLNWFAKPG